MTNLRKRNSTLCQPTIDSFKYPYLRVVCSYPTMQINMAFMNMSLHVVSRKIAGILYACRRDQVRLSHGNDEFLCAEIVVLGTFPSTTYSHLPFSIALDFRFTTSAETNWRKINLGNDESCTSRNSVYPVFTCSRFEFTENRENRLCLIELQISQCILQYNTILGMESGCYYWHKILFDLWQIWFWTSSKFVRRTRSLGFRFIWI